jgi:glycosyltransferase involved in cell wall biosynthesis
MKVSIVTVCFNSAATLADTLDSVSGQDYVNFEHIIKDGGSSDGTSDIVHSRMHSRLRFESSKDRGIYDAMNEGLRHASGEVVGFLNADDFFADPYVVTRIARAFGQSGADAVYGDVDMVNSDDTSKVVRRWKTGEYRAGIFRKGWCPPHPAFYARRKVLLNANGFDLQYPIAADFALILKIMEVMHCRVAYERSVWVKMRAGGNSNGSIRNILRGNLEARRAMKAMDMKPPLTFPANKLLWKIRQMV